MNKYKAKNKEALKLILFILFIAGLNLCRIPFVTCTLAAGLICLSIIRHPSGLWRRIWMCRMAFILIAVGAAVTFAKEGCVPAALYLLRLSSTVLASCLYMSTSEPLDIIISLKRIFFLKDEYTVPMVIALESLPLLADSFDRLRFAEKSRGIDIKKYFTARKMLMPLFMLILGKSKKQSDLLRLKCYRIN